MSDIKLVSKDFSDNHYLKTRIEDESIFVDGPVKFMGTVLGANGSPFITGPLPPEFNYVREDTSEQLLFLGQGDAVNFNTIKMYAGDIDIKADSSCNIYCSNGITLNPGYYGSVSIAGSLYDKNGNEITGGGSKWVVDESGLGQTWVTLGKDEYGATVNSVFVSGPLYDKDGKEIKGSGGGGGAETKAESWLLGFDNNASECSFNQLLSTPQVEMETARVWTTGDYPNMMETAIVKFTSEKSMVEVCEWLYSKARIAMGESLIGNAYEYFKYYHPQVLCPWPKDEPWP